MGRGKGWLRLTSAAGWVLLLLWLLAQVPTFVGVVEQDDHLIDFLTYHRAADALVSGESPYLPPEAAQRIWRSFHQAEAMLLAASARAEGQEVLPGLLASPQLPGPYVYPPTLALLVAQFHLTDLTFAALLGLAIFGFTWLWLRGAGASGLWALLVVGSWDVLASWTGGNVELLLLFVTLLAARLLWGRWPWLAAPLIALVVLIKPFYVLFFLAFGAIQILTSARAIRPRLRPLAVAAALSGILIGAEVLRWAAPVRAEAFHYVQGALEYHWFVLPVAEQTPMSAWNRTPFQALISAGLPVTAAQWVALGLWLLLAAVTLWRVRGRAVSLSLVFALAFVMLYLGRPVGWGLNYLELVVLVAVWPALTPVWRLVLLGATLALMGSHWWALVLTLQGQGLPLLTLQGADLPWETWLVLPFSWALLLKALPPRAARFGHPTEHNG